MALLGNYTVTNKCPIRFLAGSAASVETGGRASVQRNGSERNRFYVDQETAANKLWAEPSATYPPASFTMLPQKGGWVGSRNETWVTFSATAAGLRGMPGTAAAEFSITTNTPAGELVTTVPPGGAPAEFSVTTGAALLTASINGVGSAAFAVTTGTSLLGAEASLIGASALAFTASASILPLDDSPVLREAVADLFLSGSLTRYAIGHMIGTTDVASGVTNDSVAQAVWRAIAADFNEPGTTGAKLNSASAAGDPWTAELPGAYPPGSAGDILGNLVAGLTPEQDAKLALCETILRGKSVTDPSTGVMTIYAEDGVTPVLTANIWENTAGTQAYRGQGVERRERLV